MSKKKIAKNQKLELQNKVNVFNKRISKQRKKVINLIKLDKEGYLIKDPVVNHEYQKLENLERDRNILKNKLIR